MMRNNEVVKMDKIVGAFFDSYKSGTSVVTVTINKNRCRETLTLSVFGAKICVPYGIVESLVKSAREEFKNKADEPLPGQVELNV